MDTACLGVERASELLNHLNEQIKRTEELIRTHLNHHPGLKRQSQLLDSIPGIAETTAALLLSEITDITQYRSARQVAAYAGLVPRERQSGTSVRGRAWFWRRLRSVSHERLIFVDEAGVNTVMTRRYGRAPRGESAHDSAPRNYGEQTSLISALGLERGLPATMTVQGAVDTLL